MRTEQAETDDEDGLGSDRLTGVEAIARFIDPHLSLWKAQKLLEDGTYPSVKEGHVYVASKAAIRQRWREMTSAQLGHGSKPRSEATPPKKRKGRA
jgi:hypothetical protein